MSYGIQRCSKVAPDAEEVVTKLYKVAPCVVRRWAITQKLNILEQLRSGVRFVYFLRSNNKWLQYIYVFIIFQCYLKMFGKLCVFFLIVSWCYRYLLFFRANSSILLFSVFYHMKANYFEKIWKYTSTFANFSAQPLLYLFQIPRPADMHELQRQQFLLRPWPILRRDIRSISADQTISGRAPEGIRYFRLSTFLQFLQRWLWPFGANHAENIWIEIVSALGWLT